VGGIGRQNPGPFQIGGGRSEFERIWFELRKAIGDDGAGPIDSLEDTWRQSKAAGIVMATAMGERALNQFFPFKATDHLGVYEDLLRVAPASTEQGRRDAITAAFTRQVSAIVGDLRGELQAIDPGLDYLTQTADDAIVAHAGKYLRPRPAGGGPATQYGSQAGSKFPNFSSHFIVTVLWSGLTGGIAPASELKKVQDLLNDTLPAWVDWRVINATGGFFLDGFNDSLLSITPFS